VGNGLLNSLLDTERSISGGVKVSGTLMKGSSSGSPGLDIRNLHEKMRTICLLSFSLTLTMCPKEGITLMLMLLSEGRVTRLLRLCSGKTFN